MRTGENDKLDAKHNAGVGPGIRQLGQRGESRGNFSLFLSLSFRFTPLSLERFIPRNLSPLFFSLSYDVKIERCYRSFIL